MARSLSCRQNDQAAVSAVTSTGRSAGGMDAKGRHTASSQRQTVKAYSQSGDLLAFYPATVGSDEKPTPDCTLKIISIDANPTYRYNPEYKFRGVKSKKAFAIGPGPNNPVGIEWIGLSKEGYGIHGMPEPSKVSKAESHGCIRLTNWDAVQLASMVKKGVSVEFQNSQGKGSH